MVLIAIPMGWIAWKVNRANNQRFVMAELQKLDAEITYDPEVVRVNGLDYVRGQVNGVDCLKPPLSGPQWLTQRFGVDYFIEVVGVTVEGPQVTDETILLISKLPEVKEVDLTSAAGITDRGLIHFAAMPNLKGVALRSDGITDNGLAHFSDMHNLEGIGVASNRVTGVGLVHLTGLKRLKSLWIDGSITDSYLEHVSKLTQLESLQVLSVAKITNSGLAHIAKLTDLQSLGFGFNAWLPPDGSIKLVPAADQNCMTVTDDGLVPLYGLKKLTSLFLRTSQVSQAGIDMLGRALPKCDINWDGRHDADPIDGDDGESTSKPEESGPRGD